MSTECEVQDVATCLERLLKIWRESGLVNGDISDAITELFEAYEAEAKRDREFRMEHLVTLKQNRLMDEEINRLRTACT